VRRSRIGTSISRTSSVEQHRDAEDDPHPLRRQRPGQGEREKPGDHHGAGGEDHAAGVDQAGDYRLARVVGAATGTTATVVATLRSQRRWLPPPLGARHCHGLSPRHLRRLLDEIVRRATAVSVAHHVQTLIAEPLDVDMWMGPARAADLPRRTRTSGGDFADPGEVREHYAEERPGHRRDHRRSGSRNHVRSPC
jgi:hypothetical protein